VLELKKEKDADKKGTGQADASSGAIKRKKSARGAGDCRRIFKVLKHGGRSCSVLRGKKSTWSYARRQKDLIGQLRTGERGKTEASFLKQRGLNIRDTRIIVSAECRGMEESLREWGKKKNYHRKKVGKTYELSVKEGYEVIEQRPGDARSAKLG